MRNVMCNSEITVTKETYSVSCDVSLPFASFGAQSSLTIT